MDFIPESSLLEHNPDTLEAIRKMYGFEKPGEMQNALDILEEWIRKQNHFLKKDFSRHRLETLLISTKGSIERAKSRLDKIYTFKTLMPKYYQDFNMIEDFNQSNGHCIRAILPKMTKDHNRVVVLKLTGREYSNNIFEDINCISVMYAEYLFSHDYMDGFIFIADYTEADLMEFCTKICLTELRQASAILLGAFGVRIKAIHVVSSSTIIETLIKIFKQVVSEKVGNRIQRHNDIESLRKDIPENILPIEYRGKGKSYKVIHDEWLDLLSSEKVRSFYRDMLEARTDENCRQKQDFNNQYLGAPGTFRALSVD